MIGPRYPKNVTGRVASQPKWISRSINGRIEVVKYLIRLRVQRGDATNVDVSMIAAYTARVIAGDSLLEINLRGP
jgi:hypothetical protein